MCGISAIIHNTNNIVEILYKSLFNIQHRGQQSSGFLFFSSKQKKIFKSKKLGLVDCHLENLQDIEATMGLAHVRYPTSGINTSKEIQPYLILKPYGISLVHNGNLTNKIHLKNFLNSKNIYMMGTSDSEIILNLFYYFIEKDITKLTNEIIISTVKLIYEMCIGSFSIIIMIHDYGLIAFRDKYGIRPLVYSKKNNVIFSSETSGLDDNNYENVLNGEVVIVKKNLNIYKHQLYYEKLTPCIFEYIYFATPESYINDILVYKFREKVGEKILETIDKSILDSIDIIVPVPLTSIISATAISNVINKPIKHAIYKNRYTHRTFINTGNEIIKNIKKIKIINELVDNKNILLVDDSIVRGNTSKYIINELKKANVKNIYFACCSPPIRYPNYYGINIPSHEELIAYNKTHEEIENYLQIDKLFYLSLTDVLNVLKEINPNIKFFEDSTFTGNYFHYYEDMLLK